MALALKISNDFQTVYAPSNQTNLTQSLFEVVSDEDEDPDSDLNVIVATKIIEGKAKEAGTHTVEPLLGQDGLEKETKENEEETKDNLKELKVVVQQQSIKADKITA